MAVTPQPPTQQELYAYVDGLIIDNTTQYITPYIMRQALHKLIASILLSNGTALNVSAPLTLDQFSNLVAIPRASETVSGYLHKDDFASFAAGGGGGIDPVARGGALKLKAKGFVSGVLNTGVGIEVGDIVFGFKLSNYYWESAICRSLSGGDQIRANYDELSGYNL